MFCEYAKTAIEQIKEEIRYSKERLRDGASDEEILKIVATKYISEELDITGVNSKDMISFLHKYEKDEESKIAITDITYTHEISSEVIGEETYGERAHFLDEISMEYTYKEIEEEMTNKRIIKRMKELITADIEEYRGKQTTMEDLMVFFN